MNAPFETSSEEKTGEPQAPAANRTPAKGVNAKANKAGGKMYIVLLVILALVAGGAWAFWTNYGLEKTDDAVIEAHVIPVAPKLSGYVIDLAVKDNQHVKKGDILLKIDPRDYEIAVATAQAELDSAKAKLLAGQHNHASTEITAPSSLASAQAIVASAQAEWNNARKTLKRLQGLNDTARSRQSLDDAIAAEKSARSNLASAQAQLDSAQTAPDTVAASEATVQNLKADVEKAQAALDLAKDNLDHTTLYAPVDGRVTRRTVEQGAYLQPGQQVMSLVGDDVWVVANFKETQLDKMKPGQPVDIHVDAYPDHVWKGRVDSIQAGTGARFSLFPPENATGNFVKVVQRVPVKIIFTERPADNLSIGPGMSVEPVVHVLQ